jgi:predicted metalloprotease with PDZ domain
VERRYVVFFASALAIVISSQLLQAWLFPEPPAAAVAEPEPAGRTFEPVVIKVEGAQKASENVAEIAEGAEVSAVKEAAPRTRFTLGSLDPADPSRMLVTLTSRGAAVERIELSDDRFHDQEDRSGYLGHLAAEAVPEGCRVTVVGPGTPAALAGLQPGDVIVTADGAATADPTALGDVLAGTRPGHRVPIEVRRGDSKVVLEAVVGR